MNTLIDLTGAAAKAEEEDRERIAATGERLRTAFRQACTKEKVRGRLVGPPHRMRFVFEAQEAARPELILKTFLDELETRGVIAGPELRAGGHLDEEDVQTAAAALRDTVRRVRALMIAHNSYLSAGLPYVFPTANARLRSRGLCIYRYPARAAADVAPAGDAIRITFHPGPLGEVTSSGFYVPTRLRGDLAATVRFRLRRWRPGPDSASLALFAQDEPSMVRFYAQRFTEAGAPEEHRAQANLNDAVSAPVAATGDTGAFRLLRRGTTVSSWYGDGRGWTRLGEVTMPEAPDLFVGAKIWSGARCDGLEADLFALEIEAAIPEDQPLALEERPDPRQARS